MTFPVRVKVSSAFLVNLIGCEEGRHSDAEHAREAGEDLDRDSYHCVFNDFSGRFKTIIECRNINELAELYYVCKSGTIDVAGYKRTADRVAAEIAPMLRESNPDLLRVWK